MPRAHVRIRAGTRARPGVQGAVCVAALLGLLALAACGVQPPPPTGELLGIRDDQHRVMHPGKLGATATGTGCGADRASAMTSARRVAHFNLRRLTGQARYVVHFKLLGEHTTLQQVCVTLAATAVEPLPYDR